ncbi:MAG: Putative phosphoribosyltransferase [Anaerolineaceae bacterium 46_22]|nr:MAG: Putative phosphoribosyltransferase [Anaerolineaceae bacterium 46_22]
MLKNQIATRLYKGFWTALDWVYPPSCAVCEKPGYALCLNCSNEILFISGKVCSICGVPIHGNRDVCQECCEHQPAYDGMRNVAFYGGVIRECVHALKYQNNQSLGRYFSDLMLPVVMNVGWHVDVVIPVPLSRERYKERGYNQAAAIARPLAIVLEKPFVPFGLAQIRDTKSQVGLSGEQRRQNVVGAFKAIPELVNGKNILLVDDVMTTGSTMESCAKALKVAGADKVYCITIARFLRLND